MANDFLQDSDGNKSSKRLWGSICIANGILLKNGEWIFAILGKILTNEQSSIIQEASSSLINIGCILLGLGLGERLNTILKKK